MIFAAATDSSERLRNLVGNDTHGLIAALDLPLGERQQQLPQPLAESIGANRSKTAVPARRPWQPNKRGNRGRPDLASSIINGYQSCPERRTTTLCSTRHH
jgi:hypothetical protein